jgi:basic membrane protein A and related proteins
LGQETGGSFREIEMQSEAQREQALRRFAEAGANPVVMTGFAFGNVLEKVAPDFPDTKFGIIDMVVDRRTCSRSSSRSMKAPSSSAWPPRMASESGTVGFVGGMDIPLIRKFACGYAQGVKAVNPDATSSPT